MLVENLDRWGADEILIQCIDRSLEQVGPDFALMKRIGAIGVSTPLIYAGGIRNSKDAVSIVSVGADRISVDTMLWNSPDQLQSISRELGTQALIANMPVRVTERGLTWRNYRSNEEILLTKTTLARLYLEWVSEVMLTDWANEGVYGGFDQRIPELFPQITNPLLVFGGLSESAQLQKVLSQNNVVAAGVGNFLNYKEHAIQRYKKEMTGIPIRSAEFPEE